MQRPNRPAARMRPRTAVFEQDTGESIVPNVCALNIASNPLDDHQI